MKSPKTTQAVEKALDLLQEVIDSGTEGADPRFAAGILHTVCSALEAGKIHQLALAVQAFDGVNLPSLPGAQALKLKN